MRTSTFLLATIALATGLPQSAHCQLTPRQRILLDSDWRFQLAAPLIVPGGVKIEGWRYKLDDNGPKDADEVATADTSPIEWADTSTGNDIFNGRQGYAWMRTDLPSSPGSNHAILLKVDDNADVYLNGIKLAHHEGWNTEFIVHMNSAWKRNGTNELAILVQNTAGAGGVDEAVFGTAAAAADPIAPDYNDHSWRTVHLPHDYVVEGKFTPTADAGHGSLPTQPAWYRKRFTLPPADKGKSVWIDFDGVYRDSVVYLNGTKLGEFHSGYAPFRYDISSVAKYGSTNLLAVSVDPTAQEGWWYEGGGIYRHVWLNVADPIHVAPFGTFVTSSLHDPTPSQPEPTATLTIQTQILSPGGGKNVKLVSTIIGSGGNVVAQISDPEELASDNVTATQTIVIPHAQLWSLEKRNMYSLRTALYSGDKLIDNYATSFGIRTIRFDAAKGFFLNGKPVKIKGTCNHQDFAGVGIAVSDSLEHWRVKTLEAMGSNGWRTSHNPPTTSLLDACDKLGMLVMDENRHLGDSTSPKSAHGTPYYDLSELDSMILRDRNHPSVIMWSMCNEEPLEGSPEGARIFKAMRDSVRRLDTSRPVTCAMDGGYQTMKGISGVEDLQGINYHPSAYIWFHQQHPDQPLFGSETASTVSTRGVYDQVQFTNSSGTFEGLPDVGWVSAYDQNHPNWAQTAETSWPPQADNPFVEGGFAWTGFDYKGEPTPFGWPDINSNFGIIDECGFPKDNYYYYKAWWTDKPVVHVFPHWNWAGKEDQAIPVWVYSNAASVDLVVNGVSQGQKTMPNNGHVEWSVLYVPGKVVAFGYDAAGKLIGSDTVETTGQPAAIRLNPDRTKLFADGEDVIPVEVDIVDAKGRIVPTAGNRVTFTVSGLGVVAGVGNGNPSDHDPDKANYRLAFNGKCLVILGSKEKAGKIELTAASAGLRSATATFVSVPGTSSE
jgi:beta-galactosidase